MQYTKINFAWKKKHCKMTAEVAADIYDNEKIY